MSSDANLQPPSPDAQRGPAQPGSPPEREEPLQGAAQAQQAPEGGDPSAQPASVVGEAPAGEPPAGQAPPRRRILIGSQRDPAAYRPRPWRDWVSFRKKKGEKGKPQEAEKEAAEQPPKELADQPHSAAAHEPHFPPADQPQPAAAGHPQAAAADESQVVVVLPSAGELPQVASTAASVDLAMPSALACLSVIADATVEPGTVAPVPVHPPAAPQAAAVDAGLVVSADARAAAPAEPAAGVSGEPAGRVRGGEERRPRRPRSGRDRHRDKPSRREADLPEVMLPPRSFPPPSVRDRLSPELEQQLQEALGDVPVEELMAADSQAVSQLPLEPDSRQTGRVIAVQREDVFVELGSREQGILPLGLFTEPPLAGAEVEIVVRRFNPEDGLYELSLPNVAASVGDWSQVSEGMVVEARVTGHNSGGLECDVSHLAGFIPVSQISLYRVENLEEFVEQKFTCLVTEVNAGRKKLVLSRRAILERERQEARQALMQSLAPGQIREGVVRKLLDFGAFVDLGSGVDGLIHVSQLGWGRVKHPNEVLQEGQRVQVRIDKLDAASGRIGLGYRELVEENPWTHAEGNYLPNTPHRGRVVKIMEFGAFVELEPGLEGLVHISELSHRRVARTSDVVHEGDEIDVMVLAVDAEARRISLSMKNLLPPPEPEAPPAAAASGGPGKAAEAAPPTKPKKQPPAKPLVGGLGKSPGGDRFGLKW